MGDRKDYFESMKDVWEMFRVVMDERKKREIDPTQQMLRECLAASPHPGKGADEAYTRERLSAMLEFFDSMGGWYDQMKKLPTTTLLRLLKLGDKIAKFLGR